MVDRLDTDRDRELIAAELALGLLEGDALAEARRRLLADPGFRASHAYWQNVAEQWLEDIEPATGTIDLMPAIDEAIDGLPGLPAGRTPGVPTGSRPFYSWAMAATVAALVAGTAAIVFYQRDLSARQEGAVLAQRLTEAQGERQVAQISGDENSVLVSAIYDPAGGTIQLRMDIASSAEKVPELWVIPADGKPRSLGTFNTSRATLTITPELKPFLTEGATLAVTMEPSMGAPHTEPSGPVLGATELRTL